MECVPTENAVSAKISLLDTTVDYCHGQRVIFASADSIAIGRIGERHGPEGRRSGAGF
jgi:hypothetical protein